MQRSALVFFFALPLLAAVSAAGQDTIDIVQDLELDEPEGWAMAFFTSVSLMTSLGPVEERPAGEMALGLEAITVPHLSAEQRTVGFGGFKEEDLNRSPAWARLRLDWGWGGGFNLSLGATPPLEVDGVKASLFSLAVEKHLLRRGSWQLGVRAYGQTGKAKGDLTCAEGGDETFPPGSPENPFGCEGPSKDEVTLGYYGLELVAGYRFGGRRDAALHFGAAWNSLDMEFQVDAMTYGLHDRTLLRADGDTVSWTAGLSWDLGRRGRVGTEVFYSPLDVTRLGKGRESDDLLNVRWIYRFKVREGRP